MFTVWKKKSFIIALIIVAAGVSFFACYYGIKAAEVNALQKTVVIDAGHGGRDGGVTGITTGIKESDLNLKYSFLLKEALEKQGFKVIMTRMTEAGLYDTAFFSEDTRKGQDMRRRKEIIQSAKPSCVISIHMNFYPQYPSARGAQVFYNGANASSKALAAALQGKLNNLNRENLNKSITQLPGDYFMVKCTEYPSCIVECGFLSNANDEKLLIDPKYQSKLIYELASGVLTFLNTL